MEEKTIKVYKFEELKDEIKEKVLDNFRQTNVDYDWWDCSLEYISEQIKEKIGIDISSKDIHFDFGNGCNIYIESQNVTSEISYKYKELESLDLPIKFGCFTNYMGGGMNSNLKYNEVDLDNAEFEECEFEDELRIAVYNKSLEEIKSKIEDDLDEVHKILEQGFKDLWEEYHNNMSDESVKETIECNEYQFLEDGEQF